MAKAEINLLAPSVQQARRQQLRQVTFHRLYWRLWLVVGVLGVGLVASYGMLRRVTRDLEQAVPVAGQESKVLAQEVQAANQLLQAMHERQQHGRPWLPLVMDVLQLLPRDVEPKSVEVQMADDTLHINGTAQTRPPVVRLEQQLKALPWVEQVEAPLTNFAVGEGGVFMFTIHRRSNI